MKSKSIYFFPLPALLPALLPGGFSSGAAQTTRLEPEDLQTRRDAYLNPYSEAKEFSGAVVNRRGTFRDENEGEQVGFRCARNASVKNRR